MNIALYDPATTGHHIEYASYIIQNLSEAGYTALYITPDNSERTSLIKEAGAEVYYCGKQSKTSFAQQPISFLNVRSAMRISKRNGADLFHHLFIDSQEPMISSALSTSSMPTLFTLFNPHYNPNGLSISRAYGRTRLAAIEAFSWKSSFGGMFVHTDRIKENLIHQSRILDPSDIHVIPDPIELPTEKLSKKLARQKLGIEGPDPIFLFFGGLRSDKGPDLLLEAVQSVDRDGTLLIAGTGDAIDKKDIKAAGENARMEIEARIEFVPDSEIYTYFFASDVVVMPYRPFYSGTSGILQRASAATRPVISTDVGEVGWIVKGHQLGYVVEPNPQSLSEVMETCDTEDMKTNSEANLLTYANEHSVDCFAEDVLNVYKKCI